MLLQGVAKPQGQTVRDVALAHMQAAGFRPVSGDRTTINGLDAFVGVVPGPDRGPRRGDEPRRAHRARRYVLPGCRPRALRRVSTGRWRLHDCDSLVSSVDGRRSQAIRPSRVDFYIVRDGDTWASLAERSGGAIRPSTLAVMNQSSPGRRSRVSARASGSWWRDDARSPRRPRASALAPASGPSRSVCSPTCISRCPTCGRSPAPIRRTTAFMELREREAGGRGQAGETRAALGAVLAHLDQPAQGRARRRGQRLLRSRGHRRRRDQEVDPDEHREGRIAARRQHDHAAARQESVSVAVARSAAQGQGADDHVAARDGAVEGAHLRDLPERDRVGRSRLGRRSRGAHLLRRAGLGAVARTGGTARRCDHQSRALYSPANPRGRLLRRQQIILARMPGTNRLSRSRSPMPVAMPEPPADEVPPPAAEPASPTVIEGSEGDRPAEPARRPSNRQCEQRRAAAC